MEVEIAPLERPTKVPMVAIGEYTRASQAKVMLTTRSFRNMAESRISSIRRPWSDLMSTFSSPIILMPLREPSMFPVDDRRFSIALSQFAWCCPMPPMATSEAKRAKNITPTLTATATPSSCCNMKIASPISIGFAHISVMVAQP